MNLLNTNLIIKCRVILINIDAIIADNKSDMWNRFLNNRIAIENPSGSRQTDHSSFMFPITNSVLELQ